MINAFGRYGRNVLHSICHAVKTAIYLLRAEPQIFDDYTARQTAFFLCRG